MEAHIVVGESGEYSDYRTWNVAVYTDKDKANERAIKANTFVKENPDVSTNPHDDKMHTTYDVEYSVETVPFEG